MTEAGALITDGFGALIESSWWNTWSVAALISTLLILALVSLRLANTLYRPVHLGRVRSTPWLRTLTSLCSMFFLFGLIGVGILGADSALSNALPLYFWAVWWVGVIALHGVVGNLWYYINPWSGLFSVLQSILPSDSLKEREAETSDVLRRLEMWPAISVWLLFALFYLAYPSPDDPFRLALLILTYWVCTFIAMCWFGEQAWSNRGEFITVITRAYSRLAPVGIAYNRFCIGIPGWQVVHSSPRRKVSVTTALFILFLLGVGGFDAISNTPWWDKLIGAVLPDASTSVKALWHTVAGLVISNGLVILAFAVCVWTGKVLARASSVRISTDTVFCTLAPALLPLAFACHLAHHLGSLLVSSEVALLASADFAGINMANLWLIDTSALAGPLSYVAPMGPVVTIQAALILGAHVLSTLIAYTTALKLLGSARKAVLCVFPVLCFITACTLMGLQVVASV